jgi:hypothetical protein
MRSHERGVGGGAVVAAVKEQRVLAQALRGEMLPEVPMARSMAVISA